jgi:hypothetical protein
MLAIPLLFSPWPTPCSNCSLPLRALAIVWRAPTAMGQQQMQVQLMATAFNNFETQFNQAGPNAAVQMRYGQLKQQFSILQHSVLMNSGRMR